MKILAKDPEAVLELYAAALRCEWERRTDRGIGKSGHLTTVEQEQLRTMVRLGMRTMEIRKRLRVSGKTVARYRKEVEVCGGY